MVRQRLSRLLLLPIAPLTLLVFSARLSWTQEETSAGNSPIQLSSLAARLAAVPEAKILLHPANQTLLLPFAPNQGPTPSLLKPSSLDIGYHLSLTKNNESLMLWQHAKIDPPQVKANHFTANTPREWLTDVTRNKVHEPTADPGHDVRRYGQRIPWAGRIIPGIGEQGKFHPRVVRVLKLLEPRGLCVENRVPRGSARNIPAVGRGQFR